MATQRVTSAEQAIDGLAIAIFIPILAISIPAIASIGYTLAALIVVGPIVWYIKSIIIDPLKSSKPISRPDLNALIGDNDVKFRVSATVETRALDFGFQRYIIFKEQDLAGHYQDWRALIGHEYAHLKYGDARYFHYAGIGGMIVLLNMAFFSMFFLSFFLMPQSTKTEMPDTTSIGATFMPILMMALSIFLLFWVRQSLHTREFRADQEGHRLHREAFSDWMRRTLRHEVREARGQKLKLARIAGWFTHPSFARREAALRDLKLAGNFRMRTDVLRSLAFLYGGGILSYAVFTTPDAYLDADTNIPLWAELLFYFMLILPVGAACGAVSVSAMKAYDYGGLRSTFVFSVVVAIVNWLVVTFFYYSIVLFEYYDTLTADITPVPEGNISTGTWASLHILMNFAASLFILTIMASKVLRRFRYNPIVHVVIGALTVLGGFLITKLQHFLFA